MHVVGDDWMDTRSMQSMNGSRLWFEIVGDIEVCMVHVSHYCGHTVFGANEAGEERSQASGACERSWISLQMAHLQKMTLLSRFLFLVLFTCLQEKPRERREVVDDPGRSGVQAVRLMDHLFCTFVVQGAVSGRFI